MELPQGRQCEGTRTLPSSESCLTRDRVCYTMSSTMSPNPPRKKMIAIRLEPRMVELLRKLASQSLHDTTVTHLVALACEEYLVNRGLWPPSDEHRPPSKRVRRKVSKA